MYGQDELKPEWVSSAWSCFFIALILKYPSFPQLEWKKEKVLQRHFLILKLYPNFRINTAFFTTIYNQQEFKNSLSIIQHFSTINYGMVIHIAEEESI